MQKKIAHLFLIVALIIATLFCVGCDNSRYEPGGSDYGANFDWGPDHYWDTNEHTVKEKAW